MDSARQHELAGYKTCASCTKLRLYTDDFASVNLVRRWMYQEKDYEFLCGTIYSH